MLDTPDPILALLAEAVLHLTALGETVWIDCVDGVWVYREFGSEIIARAFALGLAGHGTVQ